MRNGERQREHQWEVIRLKASPAALVGIVYAADEQTALQRAVEQFRIRPADQWRFMVRKRD